MASTFECPKCGRELKVPDELLGKKVKCPACQSVFITAAEEPPAPPPVAPPSHDVTSRSVSGLLEESPEPAAEERPRKRSRRWEDDYEEQDYGRPRSRRRRAQSSVAAPAIALMVVGGLYICVSLAMLVFRTIGFSNAMSSMPQGGDANFAAGYKFGIYAGFGIELLGLLLGGLIILGAIQMKNLSSFSLAMTASIVAMIPCHYCCVLGIPFGIWSLIVLLSEDVKSAFR
jgi:hypothetical protein